MPIRPATPCAVPGCPNRAVKGGRCEEHWKAAQREYNAQRGSAAAQGYDAKWRRIRGRFLKYHELCVVCGAVATEVDHIVALKDGGTHEWSNLRAMCKRCHSTKTAREDGRWG